MPDTPENNEHAFNYALGEVLQNMRASWRKCVMPELIAGLSTITARVDILIYCRLCNRLLWRRRFKKHPTLTAMPLRLGAKETKTRVYVRRVDIPVLIRARPPIGRRRAGFWRGHIRIRVLLRRCTMPRHSHYIVGKVPERKPRSWPPRGFARQCKRTRGLRCAHIVNAPIPTGGT